MSAKKKALLFNGRGQLGPVGEDLIHFIIIGFAIAFVLIATVKAFMDYEETYRRLDTFRMGLALAEKASSDLAWAPEGDKRKHVLNASLLKEGLDCSGMDGLCVIDGDDKNGGQWFCGKPACQGGTLGANAGDVAVVSLPVTIRVDEKTYHPGIIEVTLISK